MLGAVGIASHSTVTSTGTPAKSGATSSILVIRWLPDTVLPQLSVAVQVRMVTVPAAQPVPAVSVVSEKVISTLVSQLSLAVTVGIAVTEASPHATSTSAGTPANTGGVLSCTVIVCTASALLPQASVAVHLLIRV